MGKQKGTIGFLLCIVFLLGGCAFSEEEVVKEETPKQATENEHEKDIKEPDVKEEEITLSAVGDILIHDRVYNDAKTGSTYDFYSMLEPVESPLHDSTVTFANSETVIGGEEIGLSSYPSFNSPVEVGETLQDVGVDIVSMANNHILDRGEEAIQNAISNWDDMDMMYVGSYQDEEDQNTMRIIETEEGISLGFLAYTYGTNGISTPEGKDFLVNRIDKNQMAADIEEIEEEVDVVIVSMHFGDEDVRMPNDEQKDLAQFLADKDVDIVLGHHPHVLQPAEWVEGEDGNETFVMYSLGNFFSGQREFYQKIGGVLTLKITKTEEKSESMIDVHSPQFTLTYNASEDEENYRVLPWSKVTENELEDYQKVYDDMQDHMTQWMSDLEMND